MLWFHRAVIAALLLGGLVNAQPLLANDLNAPPPLPVAPPTPYPIPETPSLPKNEKKEPPTRPVVVPEKPPETNLFPKLEIKSLENGSPKITISDSGDSPKLDTPPSLEPSTAPTNTPPPVEPGEISAIAGTPTKGDSCCKSPWEKIPYLTAGSFPRLGFFTIPGSGPGYYSFWDHINGNFREKPPVFPYPPFALQPPGMFDADFRYLEKCDNTQHDFFDHVKRMHPTDDLLISIGGQHWLRYASEGSSRLSGNDNSYFLYRNRLSVDVWYTDRFRLYVEGIDARIAGNELAPLGIDRDWADIQNLFLDVKLTELQGAPIYARVGRQELLFGSQRLVSTLDWANTRRTFQGIKTFWHSEKTDIDAFLVEPVLVNFNRANAPDKNVQFFGLWVQHRPDKGQFLDFYYLGLNNDNVDPDRRVVGRNGARGGSMIHTLGSRAAGKQGSFLYDVEGMFQFGKFINKDHCAYALTTAVGYEFKDAPWRPQVWIGNDLASGGGIGNNGDTHRTFNQLFPFGHYYMGFIDAVGRQNINDLNAQLAFYPENWVVFIAQYHHFTLVDRRDFLYNAAGRPTRISPNGTAGRDVGNEIDFLLNFHLDAHSDLQFGYSKLFAGDFLRRTGNGSNADLFYFLYNFRW